MIYVYAYMYIPSWTPWVPYFVGPPQLVWGSYWHCSNPTRWRDWRRYSAAMYLNCSKKSCEMHACSHRNSPNPDLQRLCDFFCALGRVLGRTRWVPPTIEIDPLQHVGQKNLQHKTAIERLRLGSIATRCSCGRHNFNLGCSAIRKMLGSQSSSFRLWRSTSFGTMSTHCLSLVVSLIRPVS